MQLTITSALPLGAPVLSSPTGPWGTPNGTGTVNVVNSTCAFAGVTCQNRRCCFPAHCFLLDIILNIKLDILQPRLSHLMEQDNFHPLLTLPHSSCSLTLTYNKLSVTSRRAIFLTA